MGKKPGWQTANWPKDKSRDYAAEVRQKTVEQLQDMEKHLVENRHMPNVNHLAIGAQLGQVRRELKRRIG